jgi:DNA segregation ATPase FtsK/SpoIIIE-like protein
MIPVDEFADLASVLDRQARLQFLTSVQRYAQLTGAFGTHLVISTQRPSTEVITGTIKANLTARVALSLPSHTDSMTVIDRAGAEDLLRSGDLLYYRNGRVKRLQSVLAAPDDVRAAVA